MSEEYEPDEVVEDEGGDSEPSPRVSLAEARRKLTSIQAGKGGKLGALRKAMSDAVRRKVKELYDVPDEEKIQESLSVETFRPVVIDERFSLLAKRIYFTGIAFLEGEIGIGGDEEGSPEPNTRNAEERVRFARKLASVVRSVDEATNPNEERSGELDNDEFLERIERFALEGVDFDALAYITEISSLSDKFAMENMSREELGISEDVDLDDIQVPLIGSNVNEFWLPDEDIEPRTIFGARIVGPRKRDLDSSIQEFEGLTDTASGVAQEFAANMAQDLAAEKASYEEAERELLDAARILGRRGYEETREDREGIDLQAERLRRLDPWMFDFIKAHMDSDTPLDPFDEDNLGGRPFWKAGDSSDRVWTSLGRVIGSFVGIPLSTQTTKEQTYDEIQFFWHCFNSDASWYANQPIANFLIEKNELKNVLGSLFAAKGMRISPEDVFGAINSNIIRNQASVSWGFDRLYSKEKARDGSPKRLSRYRENESLFTRDRNKIIARSYHRFGGDESKTNPTFKKPNLSLTAEVRPTLIEEDDSFIVNEDTKVARLTIQDDVASRWSSLARVLQSARLTDPRLPTLEDLNRGVADDEAAKDILEFIRNNGDDLDVRMENDDLTGHVVFKGKANRLKDLYRRVMPSFVYGGEGSMVTSARFNNLENAALSSIQLTRNITGDGLTTMQNDASGMPLRIDPSQVTLSMMGNPFLAYGQYLFADFKSGTTLDNIYAVSSINHDISPSGFKSDVTLIIPTDAYASHESAFEALTRTVALAKSDSSNETSAPDEDRPEPEE